MTINDPEIVAELSTVYPQYEAALINNDIETMQRLFWASPYVVRFGATENLHGIDEIAAFRAARSPASTSPVASRGWTYRPLEGISDACTWSSSATTTMMSSAAVKARPGCVCRRGGASSQLTYLC